MKRIFFTALLSAILFISCEENPPVTVDGDTSVQLAAFWHSVPSDTTSPLVPMSKAKVIFTSEYGVTIKYMDEYGKLSLQGLPSSTYSVSIRMNYPVDPSIQLIYNRKNVKIVSGQVYADSVIASPISSSGLAINEIYATGPVNNVYYFYDQYIELYNLSDSVKYLDGMMVLRVTGNLIENGYEGPGADEGKDGDIDGVTLAFRFPGSPGEKNYPIQPNTFLVLATDAINHKSSLATSIDLSGANWEFYNQYSANDIDNNSVPNLLNMRPEKTSDFLINLTGDIVVITSGVDTVLDDGIDISTIIDGIEYQTNSTSDKTLDERVDRGWAPCPAAYSGKSMQRREPGQDTNDGTLDWEIITAPTPGYQR